MTSSDSNEEKSGAQNAPVLSPKGKLKLANTWWAPAIILILAGLLVFIPGLQYYGIIDPSDGLYAEAAREMLERKDWITPSSNYKFFFEKPILIYWMIMTSYNLLGGVSEFAARLPVALCGVISCVALYYLVRPFLGARASLFAALSLLATPLFVVVGRVAITDVPLTLFMMMGALGLFNRLHGAHWISLAVAYVGLGSALLLKGPVPIGLVALLVFVYLLWTSPRTSEGRYRWWCQKIFSLHPFLGSAVMLSIAAPWYIVEYQATKGEFFQEFFVRQNLGRAMGNVNHQNPFWFYIPIYFAGFFPWSLLTLLDIRRYFGILKRRWQPTRRASLELFAILWLVLILGIFSVLKTKLGTYILPLAPALAILSGSVLDRIIRFKKTKALSWILLALVLVIFPVLGALSPTLCSALGYRINTVYDFVSFGFFVWLLLAFAAWQAFRKQSETAITAISCACIFACGTFIPIGIVAHYTQGDLPLKEMLKRVVRDRAQVALYMRDSPAVTFYMRRPIREINTLLDYKNYVESGDKPHYLLVTTDVMKQMNEPPPMWTLLEQRSKWHLFEIDP